MLVSEQLGVNKQGTPWVFHVLARGSDSKKSVVSNELRRVVVKVFVELGIKWNSASNSHKNITAASSYN